MSKRKTATRPHLVKLSDDDLEELANSVDLDVHRSDHTERINCLRHDVERVLGHYPAAVEILEKLTPPKKRRDVAKRIFRPAHRLVSLVRDLDQETLRDLRADRVDLRALRRELGRVIHSSVRVFTEQCEREGRGRTKRRALRFIIRLLSGAFSAHRVDLAKSARMELKADRVEFITTALSAGKIPFPKEIDRLLSGIPLGRWNPSPEPFIARVGSDVCGMTGAMFPQQNVDDLLLGVDYITTRLLDVEEKILGLEKKRSELVETRMALCTELDERHGLYKSGFPYDEKDDEEVDTAAGS